MKYIFFGTPELARDTLEYLYEEKFVPLAVVTNPDAPRGRGQVMAASETKEWAVSRDIPVLTPDKLDGEVLMKIKSFDADLAIVVAYGKILPEDLINSFPRGVLNVHYSLLPKYRGASPVESALLNGEDKTGVTIQKMVKELDAGAIVAQEEVVIDSNDTAIFLRKKLTDVGAVLLCEVLTPYLEGKINPIEQDHRLATYARKFKKEDGFIDLKDTPITNWNKYRAFVIWPGTYFFHHGKRVKITKAHLSGDSQFVIDRVIPEGKKETEYRNYLSNFK